MVTDSKVGSNLGSFGNSQPRVIVAIPCFNTASYIADVVSQAMKYVDKVIVVDDGSSDATSNVARASGAQLVNHLKNRGYGETINSCFRAARTSQADILVTLDGDGQHNPDDLPRVLKPILNGEADLVIGSRFLSQKNKMPRYRRFGINVINCLYNIGSKKKLSDTQSGFRAYSKKVLNTITTKESGMGISVELLVNSRRHGFRITEVPITCLYHNGSSTNNPVEHGLRVAITTVKCRLMSSIFGRIK